MLPRSKAQVRAHLPALAESVRVLDDQLKGQCGEQANAGYLLQELGSRVMASCNFLDFHVQLLDAFRKRFDGSQDWFKCWPQFGWQVLPYPLGKRARVP